MTANPDVVGIDFSGSQSPGRTIWITKATASTAGQIEVDSVRSASEELESTGREDILDGLVDMIAGLGDMTVGMDFPFGLPRNCSDADDWTEFLCEFKDEFADETIEAYPGTFATDGQTRRDVDYRYAGQSPLGPQIKYQVFYGLRDVLYPLVDAGDATVSPMLPSKDGVPELVEVYPAATFGRLCCYRTGYKGTGEDAERRRRVNLDRLEDAFGFELDDRDTVIENDDALDSLCAATAALRANRGEAIEDLCEVEGHIFA